jgi:signal transduction histidine kinase
VSSTAARRKRKHTMPPAEIGGTEADREAIRRRFLAMALSHELKQPLNSLNLNVELLTKRLTRIPGATADVAGPLQALSRVVDTVTACLESWYVRVQPPVAPPESTHLGPLIAAVVRRRSPLAKRRSVRLRAEVPDDLPALPAYGPELGVALENLIENAIFASSAGDEVAITAQIEEDEVRLSIVDHGSGMTPDVARRAVEIGYSTRGADGTGMTVAKFIAYHHAGGFQVDTHPGSGTTVSILLPLAGE